MAEKTKKIQLEKAMTWGGINYAPGLNEMPEAAAASALKRKFGTSADAKNEIAEAAPDFEPLSIEETMRRFQEGDSADEVFLSLKFHQAEIVSRFGGKDDENRTDKKTEESQAEKITGLPEDFPMRHVFAEKNLLAENGFTTVAEVQAFSREKLIEIDGIGEKSADAALAYGK